MARERRRVYEARGDDETAARATFEGRSGMSTHPKRLFLVGLVGVVLAALTVGSSGAFAAGARGELVRLHWKDVDFKTGTISFRDTKNGDSRTVPLTGTRRKTLQALARPIDQG